MDDSNAILDEECAFAGVCLSPKERLLGILDRIEAEVENLRSEILRMEEKKDAVFTTLDSLKESEFLWQLAEPEREDITRYAERIASRCMTVEIFVETVRDKGQTDALFQINKMIDSLVTSYKANPINIKEKCQSYIAACSDQGDDVPSDKAFEEVLLGCALDDQKRVKKRLVRLLKYLENDTKASICLVDNN